MEWKVRAHDVRRTNRYNGPVINISAQKNLSAHRVRTVLQMRIDGSEARNTPQVLVPSARNADDSELYGIEVVSDTARRIELGARHPMAASYICKTRAQSVHGATQRGPKRRKRLVYIRGYVFKTNKTSRGNEYTRKA